MRILYIDIETDSLITYEAKIVQIGIVWENGDNINEKSILINPTIPISEASTKIHSITDEMVKGSPTFKEIAPKLLELINKADLVVAYNGIYFDIPILKFEFLRCGLDVKFPIIIDPYQIWNKMEKKKLKDFFFRFTGRDIKNAHDALADIKQTRLALEAMVKAYNCEIKDLIGL